MTWTEKQKIPAFIFDLAGVLADPSEYARFNENLSDYSFF